jgi:hypothetical protein
MLTVKDAAAELDGKSRKYFLGAYDNMNFPADNKKEQLAEYLELIRDDPVFWLQSLPASWKGSSALTRARAAVTSLIRCKKVVADHKDILQDVKKGFRLLLTVKVINDEIARRNNNEPAEDYDSDASDTDCSELEDDMTIVDPLQEESLCPSEDYKGTLKQICLELSLQTDQHATHTVISNMWKHNFDDDVDTLAAVFRLIAKQSSPSEVFDILHGKRARDKA